MQGWNAYFAPKGTPPAVIAKLNDTLRKALDSDHVKKRLSELATTPAPEAERSPDYLDRMVPVEVERYGSSLSSKVFASPLEKLAGAA